MLQKNKLFKLANSCRPTSPRYFSYSNATNNLFKYKFSDLKKKKFIKTVWVQGKGSRYKRVNNKNSVTGPLLRLDKVTIEKPNASIKTD